jgi:hypothetical protein
MMILASIAGFGVAGPRSGISAENATFFYTINASHLSNYARAGEASGLASAPSRLSGTWKAALETTAHLKMTFEPDAFF